MVTLSKTSIFNTCVSTYDAINDFCQREKLFSPGQTIIIGLSGGPDSVFLLHYLHSIRSSLDLTLIAAHLDHGWRTESLQEALFCKKLCNQLDITYVQKHMRDIVSLRPSRGSQEEDARNARRVFFEEVATKYNAHAVALAHHKDDLIETFFIRLVRGSGLTGLTGIRPRNGIYIRPLLNLTKHEIISCLDINGSTYYIDETNKDKAYLRNKIRYDLVPAYNEIDSRAQENLVRTIEQLQKADNYLNNISEKIYITLVRDGWLDIEKFLILDPIIQHRALILWIVDAHVFFTPTEKFFAEVTRFFHQPESRTHWITSTWGIEKVKRSARITLRP